MIVSHKHKFIFIKTRKVAGTSVELALSRFLGPDDVITPKVKAEEALRKQLGYRGPQNYLRAFNWIPKAWRLDQGLYLGLGSISPNIASEWERLAPKYHPHIAASHVRDKVGEEVWNSYLTFTIERNPWDKVVSSYAFVFRFKPIAEQNRFAGERDRFRHFVLSGEAREWASDIAAYSDAGEVIVDRILQYHSLQQDLRGIAEALDLGDTPDISRTVVNAKGTFRGAAHAGLYTAETIDAVAKDFWREIELFGYEYPFDELSAGEP